MEEWSGARTSVEGSVSNFDCDAGAGAGALCCFWDRHDGLLKPSDDDDDDDDDDVMMMMMMM
eukprot:2917253-Rhodomonas_salina.1